MSYLKETNLNKCVSLLREFIAETNSRDRQKQVAVLALDQLRRITAGDGGGNPDIVSSCISRPRAA